jgi:hypothetical protein
VAVIGDKDARWGERGHPDAPEGLCGERRDLQVCGSGSRALRGLDRKTSVGKINKKVLRQRYENG